MTRRKSKPLLPHEISSNIYSAPDYSNIARSSSPTITRSSQQQSSSSQDSTISSQTTASSLPATLASTKTTDTPAVSPLVAQVQVPNSECIPEAKDKQTRDSGNTVTIETHTLPEISEDGIQDQPASLIRSLSQTLPSQCRPGYLANRRSASFIGHDEVSAAHSSASNGHEQGHSSLNQNFTKPSQSSKLNSSVVGLSLSLDGKAEVTTRTGVTPSPPRSQPTTVSSSAPRPNTGFQRSHSALEPIKKSALETDVVTFPKRPMTGRSRDARTWEFYCDSDARNALTEQAEREESGSATAAISLIRSCSRNRKVMTPSSNKRNAYAQKPEFTKRLKANGEKASKPKLTRATSSVARLQTDASNLDRHISGSKTNKKTKAGSQFEIFHDEGNDSDKENWEPGTQTSNSRTHRPVSSSQAARVLRESFRVPSESASLDALMLRENLTRGHSSAKSSSSEEKENSNPEMDDGVVAFMGGSTSREVEDLDCVQNLLSLSQASWQ